ncbi:PH domain-like [Phytophthora cactorum]|nr:PH domain-like [Phytophthora cactorum]
MAELECPMQTKAFNIFWHKAELRLVEQAEPEAPVFAISRPTLFGGHEEFLLQYPARLDPPTDRDITRHRFTVRHGKKRRSFQAPDAATFDTWLSALEQALEPKRESEQFHTPSSVATTATTSTAGSNGTNSQGRGSNAGLSSDTRASSRGRTSNPTSQRSHFSQPRAPALRLTLERPCFTRDPSNLKLIRLHRPAATIAEAEEADDDVLDVPDTDTEIEDEPEEEMTEKSENEDVYGSVIADEALTDEPLDVAGDNSSNGDNHSDLAEITANAGDLHDDVTLCIATEGQNDIDLAVKVVLNEAEEIESEVKLAVDALVAAVMDNTEVEASSVQTVTAPAPRSFTKEPAPKSSSRPTTLASRYKWVPLDPNSSRLIWVRCSVETDVKSAPRSNPRRKGAKPARRWVPIDPNSTRPIWIRRAESSAVRMESRYKATSNTRKWVPLDPDNSRFIWVRHHVASGKQHRH